MKKYVIALDEGTTSARAIIFDKNCKAVSVSQHEFTQIYPNPGWVEHDAMEIYANQYSALCECIAKSNIDIDEIAGIGITNQRETTVVWDKNTGRPIYNAIVWQCRRTADICEKLKSDGWGEYIKETTGLIVDAYFSATKIKWILDNVEGAKAKAENGELLFGTVDSWLIWKLTNGKVHITDRSNASRTMLYNIKEDKWDKKLLEILEIPESMLPEIKSSSEIYGYMNLMGKEIPISAVAGDQQAALFGQCCFKKGEMKSTYGTGCFLLTNIGNEPNLSKNGLLTTVAATEKGNPIEYVLEGSVFTGGAVIQWIRDELRLINESKDSEYFAKKVPSSNGVYIVPAFSGLGAPYWDMDSRGTITGISRGTNLNHIIRASLESIAYQTEDVISAMENDIGEKITSLKVDGGASANNLLMQFQADISNLSVKRPENAEATALGAAFLAGLSTGLFASREELCRKMTDFTSFEPTISDEKRKKYLDGWKKAIRQTVTK